MDGELFRQTYLPHHGKTLPRSQYIPFFNHQRIYQLDTSLSATIQRVFNMRLLIIVTSAALALSSGSYAWTRAADRTLAANNNWHTPRGRK